MSASGGSERGDKILRTNLRTLEFCDLNLESAADLRHPSCRSELDEKRNKFNSKSDINSNGNEEFCDVSLENTADLRDSEADSNKTNKSGNNVRRNLRQIANKIRVGPRDPQGNAATSTLPPDPGGEEADLPPFAPFVNPCGRDSADQGTLPKGFLGPREGSNAQKPSCQPPGSPEPCGTDLTKQCHLASFETFLDANGGGFEPRGVPPKGFSGPREDRHPQQPPSGTASPPMCYGKLSSLLCEADDTTYADSDTATAGSDSGVMGVQRWVPQGGFDAETVWVKVQICRQVRVNDAWVGSGGGGGVT